MLCIEKLDTSLCGATKATSDQYIVAKEGSDFIEDVKCLGGCVLRDDGLIYVLLALEALLTEWGKASVRIYGPDETQLLRNTRIGRMLDAFHCSISSLRAYREHVCTKRLSLDFENHALY